MNARIFASLLIAASALMASAEGQGRWLETQHDFGAFNEELGTVYCDFRLINEGDEPMSIVGARANCGCTRPEFSKDPIAPGDTAILRVGFDATGRPGKFVKRISVDLSAAPMRQNLNITGTVIGTSNTLRGRFPYDVGPAMKLRDVTIPYGEVIKGKTIGKYIEGYNASDRVITPSVTGVPDYLDVAVQPGEVPPGEQFIISTIFNSGKADGWGLTSGSFTVSPAAGSPDSQTIETIAIIKEDFSKLSDEELKKAPVIETDPQSIDLGRITRGMEPLRRTFTITNTGRSPLILRSVRTPEKAVTLKVKSMKIKPGKSTGVEVTVNPAEISDTELLNARITIISNDPLHSSRIVRVVGEVK